MQPGAITGLVDGRAVVGRLHRVDQAGLRIDRAEFAIHIAADAPVAVIPVIQVAAHQQVFIDEVAALEGNERELVLVLVRERISLPDVFGERQRQGLRAFERIVGQRQAQIEVRVLGLVTDLAEKLRDLARVVVGPATITQQVPGQEIIPVAVLATMFELDSMPAERTGVGLDRPTRVVAAALGVDRQCAAQGVQAEGRIRSGNELDAGDRRLRNQVPVDDIAERLVDAHAVLEHRQALRHTKQRRGGKAAKAHVWLERIALRGVDRDAGRILLQIFGQVALPLLGKILLRVHLHVGRHVANRGAETWKQRGADHFDRRQFKRFGRILWSADGR